MPFVIPGGRRTGRLAALGSVLATMCVAAPAQAATISNPYDCTPQATLSQTFATWGDYGQYTPVANAGVENGATGWTLSGGASVVAGNEPWKVGGASHRYSLNLPENASAVTAPMCIDQTYPYFRLFARNAGVADGALKVDVLFFDAKGNLMATKPFSYKTASTAWQPTGMINIGLFTAKTTVAAAPVAFRFTATGKGSRYQVDDVYVDPWCRR
jgi:hypothetical protein